MHQGAKSGRIGTGQNQPQNSGLGHTAYRRRRVGCGQQLAYLRPYPFWRKTADPFGVIRTGGQSIRVNSRIRVTVKGVKPEKPQNPQVIFEDTVLRNANKSDMARQNIGQATQRINNLPRCIGIERVHRKVAARGVLADDIGEGDNGVPPVGLDVLAKRRHFMGRAICKHSHCTIDDTRRNNAKPYGFGHVSHCFRQRIRCDINIIDGKTKQRITHASAYKQSAIPGLIQGLQQALRARIRHPVARNLHGDIRSASPRRIRAVAPQI